MKRNKPMVNEIETDLILGTAMTPTFPIETPLGRLSISATSHERNVCISGSLHYANREYRILTKFAVSDGEWDIARNSCCEIKPKCGRRVAARSNQHAVEGLVRASAASCGRNYPTRSLPGCRQMRRCSGRNIGGYTSCGG